MGLDTGYLNIIRKLGNWSIHPNDGDVTGRAATDHEFLDLVAVTFIFLLTLVYEVEHAESGPAEAGDRSEAKKVLGGLRPIEVRC